MADLDYIRRCRDLYRNQLVDNIMPFWMGHGLDQKHGGVYTCLNRDGSLMDTTKSVWFQGRFGFVAAAAYNHIDKRPEWLVASKSCIEFIEKHCIDTDGHMFFTVTAEGQGIQKRRYVFSECFAIIAMAEYAVATGDKHYAKRALEIFKNTIAMLESPTFLPPKTTIPGIGHSITMMLINVALVLKQVVDDPILDQQINKSIDIIATKLYHPEFGTILETVTPEGKFIDTCAGRTINPGHCIETGWFILALARSRNWDEKLVKLATNIIDGAWKWGWDKQYGGMINFRDCRNLPPQDYSQDMKFWWPQCETIIASLYAFLATRDEKYLEMHRKAHEYAFRVFADKEFGEWYGYLHRDGTVAQPAKGNIFKGPFHVPRMMIVAHSLCDDILKKLYE